MANPFILGWIPADAPICNRESEADDLLIKAKGGANVTMFSPRRFGKTTLAQRTQTNLAKEGWITIYIDLTGVTSVEDVANRIAADTYVAIHAAQKLSEKAKLSLGDLITSYAVTFSAPLLPQSIEVGVQKVSKKLKGIELLNSTMRDLGKLIQKQKGKVHICLDEFQEISDIPDCLQVEGIMRKHIQEHKAPYIFAGSRRRVLLAIFTDRKRPFYRSGFLLELHPLPAEKLAEYIVGRFDSRKKRCPQPVAQKIADVSEGHPYYAQKISYSVFEATQRAASEKMVIEGYERALKEESYLFTADIKGLSIGQLNLLKEIAKAPGSNLFSKEFLADTGLLPGTIHKGLSKLLNLDLVEQNEDKQVFAHDPLFREWLRRMDVGRT
jgi:AAA+ ATPase superfamily predicted ATPase